MPRPTVVLKPCPPDAADTSHRVATLLTELIDHSPQTAARLRQAQRIFIKLNIGIPGLGTYRGRPVAYVDPQVFAGLATFLRDHSSAEVYAGDGTDGIAAHDAAGERGHLAVCEAAGFHFLDLHREPVARFDVPEPAMFGSYRLPALLRDTDFVISLAKMKAHAVCGVTLTLKNLFGTPPGSIYGSPRVALHSPIRLPRILTDLGRILPPGIALIDGIVGCNYHMWAGDPVTSSVLIAGDNAVATDAVGARVMSVDPEAPFGTAPFLRAENHLRVAAAHGLGPLAADEITLIGEMPRERRPYTVEGAGEPETHATALRMRRDLCESAHGYFGDRERFVDRYAGQIVFIARGKVLSAASASELNLQRFFGMLRAEGLRFEEIFIKRVEVDDDEVMEAYGI